MTTEQKTKKDAFRERFAGRYPDVDMNNEDAYYDQAGRMMDEYEGFEKRAGILKENISKSPLMQDLVLASQEAENFDPIVWLAENRGLDLKALTEDGEYVKKLAEAGQKHVDAVSKGGEIKKQRETNLPGSIKACMDAAKGAGISDEEAQNTIGMMFDIMDDLIIGKINMFWALRFQCLTTKVSQEPCERGAVLRTGLFDALFTRFVH